ncbi:MAG TPA: hypothetical protein VMW94_03030, partial [Actinomycetes bacterium]|nr:hypothetical protein [Actinomycetes bacterium]
MIITAALPWWDEPPELLEACVRGIATVADRLVALDGAYARYPDGTPASPPIQAETIERVAAEVGLECLILTPHRLWRGQVEKRTYLLAAASVGSDWLVVVDADHLIRADRAPVRAELASYGPDIDVVSVTFHTPLNDKRPIAECIATNWHLDHADRTMQMSHIIRALPGLRVEGKHWQYSAIKDDRRVSLYYGDDVSRDHSLKPHLLVAPYRVEHVTLHRDDLRIKRGRAF